jgi:hypothetical protein
MTPDVRLCAPVKRLPLECRQTIVSETHAALAAAELYRAR